LSRRAADDDRFASQSRLVALFYGSVESVHIEMENDAGHKLDFAASI